MILGFGSVEEKIAPAIIKECAEAIKSADKNNEKKVKEIQKKYSDLEKKYETMTKTEAPERYSYFYYSFYEMYPGNCVVVFSFHHINRRHALSPDGWALLQTKWALSVSDVDGVSIYKQTEEL